MPTIVTPRILRLCDGTAIQEPESGLRGGRGFEMLINFESCAIDKLSVIFVQFELRLRGAGGF